MRHTFATMGTVASIELADGWAPQLPEIVSICSEIEQRYSLYLADSELSRIATGTLTLAQASKEVLDSYGRALQWSHATSGFFSVHRPDGVIDLNGIVKAEAIERIGAHLRHSGCPSWSVNIGGDILVSATGAPQLIGIADPADRSRLLCSISLGSPDLHGEGGDELRLAVADLADSRLAVATSGSAERGDHIWRGGSTAVAEFVQVTVVAADIVTADVLATAIVAGGPDALDDITARWNVDVITVDRAGALLATPRLRAALAGVAA